ncbi:MAG: class II aldolase/adducin family protein [Christensenellales bacterium]
MNIPQLAREAISKGLLFRTWGNLSKRDEGDKNSFLITPSGMGYEDMEEKDLVKVFEDGSHEGNIKPSSESPMHLALYGRFPDINVIIHTHQPYGSGISLLRRDIPLTKSEAEKLGSNSIKISGYALPGTKKLHNNVDHVASLSGCKAILLEMHGVIIMGEDEESALENALLVEGACKKYFEELGAHAIKFNEDISEITRNDKAAAIPRSIFDKRPDVNSIIRMTSQDVNKHTVMKPYLDDFAQIVGIRSDSSCKYNVVFGDGKVFCLGKDLEDATAVQHIFEKNVLAQAVAKVSRHKPINVLEAILMNQVYKRKYSKLKDMKKD